jgi:hypothetical protein
MRGRPRGASRSRLRPSSDQEGRNDIAKWSATRRGERLDRDGTRHWWPRVGDDPRRRRHDLGLLRQAIRHDPHLRPVRGADQGMRKERNPDHLESDRTAGRTRRSG